ncbi:hypothetical protein [Pantoea sp. S18]|uniref:hypothetical protein n=1 Tax=Pantoea sp. S18 TaxID=3019892 RepID=UPI002B1E9F72|nr:hypothetical protein [Pantoea sp. S18]MEA5104472.1 hypothetical protein [Pantoea sp. S18]
MTTNIGKIESAQILAALKYYSEDELKQISESAKTESECKARHKEVLTTIKSMLVEEAISTDELLKFLDIEVSTSTSRKKNSNKEYSIVLDGNEYKDTEKLTNKTFSTDTYKEVVEKVKQNEEYSKIPVEQIAREVFLQTYSKEYSNSHPLNAQFNGIKFHLNERMNNTITLRLYEQYCMVAGVEQTKQAFKQYVTEAFNA